MRKIALIGYGYWGRILLPYLEECFEVTHICHRSAREDGRFTPDISMVLASDIDAVVVATPIDAHYEIVKLALEAGKHVFCEKPLTMSYREAINLTHIAINKNLHIFTDYTYMFSRSILAARDIVDRGELGELLAMGMTMGQLGRFGSFGVYWFLASHLLSVRAMFVPLADNTFNLAEQIRGETGTITICGDVPGVITVSLNRPIREKSIVWYFSGGTITYDGVGRPSLSVVSYDRESGEGNAVRGNRQYCYDERNNLRNAVGYFKDVLYGVMDSDQNLATSLAVTKILEGLTCCQTTH